MPFKQLSAAAGAGMYGTSQSEVPGIDARTALLPSIYQQKEQKKTNKARNALLQSQINQEKLSADRNYQLALKERSLNQEATSKAERDRKIALGISGASAATQFASLFF